MYFLLGDMLKRNQHETGFLSKTSGTTPFTPFGKKREGFAFSVAFSVCSAEHVLACVVSTSCRRSRSTKPMRSPAKRVGKTAVDGPESVVPVSRSETLSGGAASRTKRNIHMFSQASTCPRSLQHASGNGKSLKKVMLGDSESLVKTSMTSQMRISCHVSCRMFRGM